MNCPDCWPEIAAVHQSDVQTSQSGNIVSRVRGDELHLAWARAVSVGKSWIPESNVRPPVPKTLPLLKNKGGLKYSNKSATKRLKIKDSSWSPKTRTQVFTLRELCMNKSITALYDCILHSFFLHIFKGAIICTYEWDELQQAEIKQVQMSLLKIPYSSSCISSTVWDTANKQIQAAHRCGEDVFVLWQYF